MIRDLIKKFGSIDYIFENIDTIEVTNSVRNKLTNGKESAFISRTLGTIRTDAPIDTDFSAYIPAEMDKQSAKSILTELEMIKFIDKLNLKDVVITNSTITTEKYTFAEKSTDEIISAVHKSGELYFITDEGFTTAYINIDNAVSTVNFADIIDILADKKIKKYTTDAKSLYTNAIKIGYNVENIAFDVLLAGYLLNPNASDYSIGTLADSFRCYVDIVTQDEYIRSCAML